MNQSQSSTTSFFQSDLWIFSIYITGTFEIVFWLCNSFLICIEIFDIPSIDQYRIQKHKKKLRFQTDLIHLIIKETIRHQISIFLLLPALYYLLTLFGHLEIHGPRPSWLTISFQLSLFILSEDAIFFWTHYLLHTPWLYKTIHKKHHIYTQPTGVVSVLSDPLEGLQNQLSVWFLPILFKEKHLFTLCLWLAIRVYQTVNAHSGYNLPYISTQYWVPWLMTGALSHDFHHQHGKWNYGSFFSIWDRLMGTHRLSTTIKQTD
jgi:sterol desaturase/sphingolipid hydroxylase (fatty acid hydroxylase superfamily)